MALILCPACGGIIISHARVCPLCGHPRRDAADSALRAGDMEVRTESADGAFEKSTSQMEEAGKPSAE